MTAYYNEIDPYAAAWLRNLIAAGHIAPGEVDERDIRDVRPDDLRGFTQCHFFAGVGVWSRALRLAGRPDDERVWTGSCPCQPFSAAGRGGGATDERHLWPHWFHLISQCAPPVVYGEQVASKAGLGWFDLVSADLEGSGYAVGANDICAAGVGAPHIRQRLWFVGKGVEHAVAPQRERRDGSSREGDGPTPRRGDAFVDSGGPSVGVADADGAGSQPGREGSAAARYRGAFEPESGDGRLADAADQRRLGRGSGETGDEPGTIERPERLCDAHRPGPTNGFWRDADWLHCRDGKWRPVEPGTFPLVNGASARVGRLRAYGNAINAEAAKEFIEAHQFARSVGPNEQSTEGEHDNGTY